MRYLLLLCASVCLIVLGGCTNDGVDLSKTDAGGNNNNPDGSNNNPDGSNNNPDGSNNNPDGSQPDADVGEPDASVPDAEVPAPTFTDVHGILMSNCGGCHIENEAGGLKLTDKNMAYSELVGVAQEASTDQGCGTTRVVANDAANSVIVQRLKGTCSNRMPKSGSPFLTDDQIKVVEDWINDGAQNN